MFSQIIDQKEHKNNRYKFEPATWCYKYHSNAWERAREGKMSEGEWEEVRVTLVNMGSIPDWYEIRYGVRFGERKQIVRMKESAALPVG